MIRIEINWSFVRGRERKTPEVAHGIWIDYEKSMKVKKRNRSGNRATLKEFSHSGKVGGLKEALLWSSCIRLTKVHFDCSRFPNPN
jgi:hypothetical protein